MLLRVYLHGILMLALAAGASFVVGTYVLTPAVEVPARPSTAWIAWHLMNLVNNPQELESELGDLKRRARLEMTLFDANGRLIASNAASQPAPLTAAEVAQLSREPTRFADGLGVVATLAAGQVQSYARVRYPMPELPTGTAAAQLAVALAVLALLSIPLARSVTAPVERLATVTRAFGAGDLSARAKDTRGDEIGDLGRAFDEMADRIVDLRRSEKELLANVSHELRTPLARIRLALELVSDGDTTRARSYLEDIEEDLAELETLLDDVMTTAQLDLARGSGADARPPLRRQAVQGRQLLEAARLRFEKRFPERSLRCEVDADVPTVDADPNLLRRVLDNLLDNAAKFSEPGAAIELEGRRAAESNSLLIRVRDRGIGVSAEDLERIFEPFFRTDRSRARATGGVGLGLAVVRRIVEAHGGDVSAESSAERGTCFSVRVPAAASAPS
jgi:signal transduction histidine kinase